MCTPNILYYQDIRGVCFMKKQAKWQSYFINAAIGMGVSLGTLLVLCLVIAIIFANGGLSDNLCAILAYGALGFSWGFGGLIAGLRNCKDGLLIGAIHGVLLFLVILLVSIFMRAGDTKLWGVKLFVYLLGGALISGSGGVIGVHMALKKR